MERGDSSRGSRASEEVDGPPEAHRRHTDDRDFTGVAEPPKLYDPHVPVIVPKTSDIYAYTPDNPRRSVGCPRRTPIQLCLTTHNRINKGVTTTLQHLLQNFISECGIIITMNL
jgi:hypothetical protein